MCHHVPEISGDPVHIRVSATLLVASVEIVDCGSHTEFHVECLSLGFNSELLPLKIYEAASDPAEIAWLKTVLVQDSLLVVRDADLCVYVYMLEFMGPKIYPFEGDEPQVRQEFERQKALREQDTGKPLWLREDAMRGRVQEVRVIATKKADTMAIATVETEGGKVEAILLPAVLALYLSRISQLGFMEFRGKLQECAEPDRRTFLVEQIIDS